MRTSHLFSLGCAALIAGVAPLAARQGAPPAAPPAQPPSAPAAGASPAPPMQGTPENPRPNQPNFIGFERNPPAMNIPAGFTPLFNGENLSGWHVSPTNHHGRSPDFRVVQGMII